MTRVPRLTRADLAYRPDRPLPGWPILAMIGGFPLWWALGFLPFIPLVAGVLLGSLMVSRRRDLVLPPAGLPLMVFVLWLIPCAVMIDTLGRYIGFGMRAGTLLSLAVIYLYIANARERLSVGHLLLSACGIWGLIVVGGVLGVMFPDVRLTTPVGVVLPGVITSNELVRDLVFPPLAEVQQPWGAAQPFNRPSAPFPYANGWGSGYALTTLLVVVTWITTKSTWMRVILFIGGCLSLIPIIASLNRGMFLMLGAAVLYAAARLAAQGHFRALGVVVAGGGLAVLVLQLAGVSDRIEERQEVSDTTSGRASIYIATLQAVARSPILGYGAPRPNEDIGINLGTQGTFWMYLFSYGVVGAVLFLTFFTVAILVTWPLVRDAATAFLHSVLVSALVGSFFYGFEFTQWLAILLALSLLWLWPRGTAEPPLHATVPAVVYVR